VLLNIGCGAVAHPDWVNLDMVPRHPLAVTGYLRRGGPNESRVPTFASFALGLSAAAVPPRKPASLCVEATKAAA